MKRYEMKFSGTLTMTFNDSVTEEEAAQLRMPAAMLDWEVYGNTNIPAARFHIENIGAPKQVGNVVPMKAHVHMDTTEGGL